MKTRRIDCVSYNECLATAAWKDLPQLPCGTCRDYVKIALSEHVTVLEIFGCWLLVLVVNYPESTARQAREVLYRILDDLMTHTEFPGIKYTAKGRPVSQWRMTPTSPPSFIPPWYKKRFDK